MLATTVRLWLTPRLAKLEDEEECNNQQLSRFSRSYFVLCFRLDRLHDAIDLLLQLLTNKYVATYCVEFHLSADLAGIFDQLENSVNCLAASKNPAGI